MNLNIDEIKILTLKAIYLNDSLSSLLVVKGGTALQLLGSIGRMSIDIDFSLCEIPEDYNFEYLKNQFESALKSYFSEKGFFVFSYRFETIGIDKNGGFDLSFKFLPHKIYNDLKSKKNGMFMIHTRFKGMTGLEKVTIQISKNEFCKQHGEQDIDNEGIKIKIYTPEMIVFEKLRALCQQMDEYKFRRNKSARARDFFDIFLLDYRYNIMRNYESNKAAYNDLIMNIFGIKQVDVNLLLNLEKYRSFHAENYKSLVDTLTTNNIESFDFYFNHVKDFAEKIWHHLQ